MSEGTEATEVEAKVDESTPEVAETVATEVVEAPVAEAVAEPVAEAEVAAVAVATDEAPADETADEVATEHAEPSAEVADAPLEDAPVPAEVVAAEMSSVRQARVFLCERGHRVTALWQTPETCQGRITRSGPVCGRPLYPMGELPEQVQKALNPLKASKKSSKKK